MKAPSFDYDLELNSEETAHIISQATYNNVIGMGASGIVYKVNYRNKVVAVKLALSGKEEALRSELAIYKYLCKIFDECNCKQNIVQMYGYNNIIPFIIAEYFDGKDLSTYLNYPISSITYHTHRLLPRQFQGDADYAQLGKFLGSIDREFIIYTLFSNIYNGIACLHSKRILHRDFELKNILIRSDGKVAITDFGTSRLVEKGVTFDNYYYLLTGFISDLDNIGPMLGNFIDSNNNIPFQVQLEGNAYQNLSQFDIRNLFPTILSQDLQDLFLLFMSFPSILSFISFIRYCNQNTDYEFARQLINDAANMYNENIQVDGPPDENERDLITIFKVDSNYVLNNIHGFINTQDFTSLTLAYFRLVIDSLMLSLNSPILNPGESVFQGIIRLFGYEMYPLIIKTFQDLIFDFGFLIKNFNLFEDVYMK